MTSRYLPLGTPELIYVGDKVSVDARVYRKWWQLWKPKSWLETRTMTVTSTHVRTLEGWVDTSRLP